MTSVTKTFSGLFGVGQWGLTGGANFSGQPHSCGGRSLTAHGGSIAKKRRNCSVDSSTHNPTHKNVLLTRLVMTSASLTSL
jgi:hypothetical protein